MNIIRKTYCLLLVLLYSTILHAQDSHWTVNIYDYQYDMSVYAQLMDDEIAISDYSNYEIAAFVGDECRGIAEVKSTTKDGQTYTWLYFRVRSNVASGEKVTFKAYDKTEGKVLKISETVEFSSQESIGMPSSPYNLHIVRFIPGDVNDDGEINSTDIMLVINRILDRTSSSSVIIPEAMDLNNDGSVNSTDIMLIINKILGR